MKVSANALFRRKRAFRFFVCADLGNRSRKDGRLSAFRFPLSAFLLALVLAGCLPREPRANLVILNGPEPQSLDPHIITGQADARVVLSLFEGLTRFNPFTGDGDPAIAERWEISPDGKIYTFHLRTNALWSTGDPITAEDFVFSWTRALDPKTGSDYAGQLYYIKNGEEFNVGKISDPKELGVKALDARTLRVELKNPTAFFLELCAFQTLAAVPKQHIEKYGDKWMGARPLPCSGAHMLESWRLNDRVRVRKNPRYWDAANVELELVDFIACTAPSTAMNLYETGNADIIWDKRLAPTELLDLLRDRPDFHSFDYLADEFIRFNVLRPPFSDVRVRKAFALAVDKKRIVERITRGGERITSHLTPDGLHYQPPEGLGYDPNAARKLLAEAGFPGGKNFPRFQYLFNSSPGNEQMAVELQAMWRNELGVEMELRQAEWKVYLDLQSKVDYDTSRSSWIGDYKDPNTFLDMFMSGNGNNRTGWTNHHYDSSESGERRDQARNSFTRSGNDPRARRTADCPDLHLSRRDLLRSEQVGRHRIQSRGRASHQRHSPEKSNAEGRTSNAGIWKSNAEYRRSNAGWPRETTEEFMKQRFRFERLECWQQARALNREIYKTTRHFPKEEIYGMTSQVRRAAVSISSNIAEGSGRNSDKDFAHFLEQAYGSAMEVASLLYLALDEDFINQPDADALLEKVAAVSAKIAALNRSLKVPASKTPFAHRGGPAFDVRPSALD